MRWFATTLFAVQFAVPCAAWADHLPLLAQNWQRLSPSERYEALENYKRHRAAPEEKRRKVERQYERWQEMPESERDRIRKNYESYRKMQPSERRQFHRKYKTWKNERRK